MPRKRCFEADRLHTLARNAAQSASLPGAELTCTYREEHTPVSSHARVSFQWHLKASEFEENQTVNVRADNIASHGIPLPESWCTASRCLKLDEIAARSADAEGAKIGLAQLSCTVLGQAKHAPLPALDAPMAPGAAVSLQTSAGERLDFLLCAHVEGDRWYCHRGSFDGDALNGERPFDLNDLCLKDLLRDAWEPDAQPTKRIRRQPKLGLAQLREVARSHAESWSHAVAVATFKAEELRADFHKRPMDLDAATVGFVKNPFLWGASMRQSNIFALWAWRSNDIWRHSIISVRLKNALERQCIPPPSEIDESDNLLYERLKQAAERETARHKAPCKYLGLPVGSRFEPVLPLVMLTIVAVVVVVVAKMEVIGLAAFAVWIEMRVAL